MPGTTAVTYDNEVLSLATQRHLKRRGNLLHVPYVVTDAAMRSAVKVEGGDRVQIAFELYDHSSETELTGEGYNGFETFSQPTHTPGWETFFWIVQPVFLSEVERFRYGTAVDQGIRKTLGRVDNVKNALRKRFQLAALNGGAASLGTWAGLPAWTNMVPINGIDHTNGIIEETASGTNTLHNLAKTSFPVTTHPQLHNVVVDVADNIASNLLPAMSLGRHEAESRGNPFGKTHEWYLTRQLAQGFDTVYRAYEKYEAGDTLDEGTQFKMMIAGSKAFAMPATANLPLLGATTTGTQLSGLGLSWGEQRGIAWHGIRNFQFGPWKDFPGTADVQYCLCWVAGQMCSGEKPGENVAIINAQA
jgi:hypothetical protein